MNNTQNTFNNTVYHKTVYNGVISTRLIKIGRKIKGFVMRSVIYARRYKKN